MSHFDHFQTEELTNPELLTDSPDSSDYENYKNKPIEENEKDIKRFNHLIYRLKKEVKEKTKKVQAEKTKQQKAIFYQSKKGSTICACGGRYDYSSKSSHIKKSIRHHNYMNPEDPKPKRTTKPKEPTPGANPAPASA